MKKTVIVGMVIMLGLLGVSYSIVDYYKDKANSIKEGKILDISNGKDREDRVVIQDVNKVYSSGLVGKLDTSCLDGFVSSFNSYFGGIDVNKVNISNSYFSKYRVYSECYDYGSVVVYVGPLGDVIGFICYGDTIGYELRGVLGECQIEEDSSNTYVSNIINR